MRGHYLAFSSCWINNGGHIVLRGDLWKFLGRVDPVVVPLGVTAEDIVVFEPPPTDLAENEAAASSSVVPLVTAEVFWPMAVEFLSSAPSH